MNVERFDLLSGIDRLPFDESGGRQEDVGRSLDHEVGIFASRSRRD